MHKSVFTFGFLASSLVMLVLVLFLNQQQQNSFSNPAMAQYDKYGDSYCSTYQTDDKKYESRTGPFEGFLVISVEFCIHVKFEDRKDHARDNRTGTKLSLLHKVHLDLSEPLGQQVLKEFRVYKVS